MRVNYGTAKVQLAPYIANGTCPTDPIVGETINDACARLIDSGKWKNSIRRGTICHRSGIITFPQEIETILEFADCGVPVTTNNAWYEFLPGGPFQLDNQCNSWPALVERGTGFCTAFDNTEGMKVRLYSDWAQDDGKAVLLQGINSDGNEVQTLDGSDVVNGEILIANNATPPISTITWKAAGIRVVQKELTVGPLRLYQVDPATNENAGLLAVYQPNEEIPSYRRYYYGACLHGCNTDDGETTIRYRPLSFLAKIAHVPLVNDTDVIPITAAGALKNMVIALWMEKTNNPDMAAKYEARAIQCLMNELKQYQGSQVHMKSIVPGFGNRAPAYSRY